MTGAANGLLDGARNLAGDGVRMLRTRLELLAIEVQAEKALVVRQLVVSAAVLFLASFGTLLLILWLVLSLPEGDRQLALGGVGVAFLAFGATGAAWLRYAGATHSPLRATIGVLKGDEQALRGSNV
jgi:uncharacterized membrane protein YqjE